MGGRATSNKKAPEGARQVDGAGIYAQGGLGQSGPTLQPNTRGQSSGQAAHPWQTLS